MFLLTAMHSLINFPQDRFLRYAIVFLNSELQGFEENDMTSFFTIVNADYMALKKKSTDDFNNIEIKNLLNKLIETRLEKEEKKCTKFYVFDETEFN